MTNWMRVSDCTKHCGMPVEMACILFGILGTICNIYTFRWLPFLAAILISFVSLCYGVITIIALRKHVRFNLLVCTFIAVLLEIPVLVVIGFISLTLASHDTCWLCQNSDYYCYLNNYRQKLCYTEVNAPAWLWSAIIVAFLATIFEILVLSGYRKFNLHLAATNPRLQTQGETELETVHPQQTTLSIGTVLAGVETANQETQQPPQMPQAAVYFPPQVFHIEPPPVYREED